MSGVATTRRAGVYAKLWREYLDILESTDGARQVKRDESTRYMQAMRRWHASGEEGPQPAKVDLPSAAVDQKAICARYGVPVHAFSRYRILMKTYRRNDIPVELRNFIEDQLDGIEAGEIAPAEAVTQVRKRANSMGYAVGRQNLPTVSPEQQTRQNHAWFTQVSLVASTDPTQINVHAIPPDQLTVWLEECSVALGHLQTLHHNLSDRMKDHS